MGEKLEILVVHPATSLKLAPLVLRDPEEFNSFYAGSATQAIHLAREKHYDIILIHFELNAARLVEDTDIAPELSYLTTDSCCTQDDIANETIAVIRRNSVNSDTPIIVYAMCGPDYREIRQNAINAGANLFYVEQISSDESLLRKIHDLAARTRH